MAGAKLYIIPHPDNGHWPHLLRHHHLAKVSALLIFLKIAAIGIIALTPNTAYLSTITTNRIVQLTNEERKKSGLAELTVNAKLSQAALKKGQDMLANQYFAHISPSGVTPWFWMKKVGYSYSVAGENLAIDFVDAESVVSAWLNSPTHTANLLGKDYSETGVAVVSGSFEGGTSIIVVHMFGLPLGASAPSVTAPEPTSVKATPAPVPTVAAAHSAPRASGTPTPAITPVAASTATPEPTEIPTPEPTPTPSPEPATLLLSQDAPPPSILISPAFDQDEIALVGTGNDGSWQVFSTRSQVALNAMTLVAVPLFAVTEQSALHAVPSSIIFISRQGTAGILITVAVLLSLTIVIRIRVQHPALITHASLVIMLASILLIS